MKIQNSYILLILVFMLRMGYASAQNSNNMELSIKYDSLRFLEKDDQFKIGNDTYLAFPVQSQQPVLVIDLKADVMSPFINTSEDYSVLDTLKLTPDHHFIGRIQLNDMLQHPRPILNIGSRTLTNKPGISFKLLPLAVPGIDNAINTIDAFQEEQKIIEIPVSNGFNIKAEDRTIAGKDFDYKVSYLLNLLQISVKPHTTGVKQLRIPLTSTTPILVGKTFTNDLEPLTFNVNVKAFKLSYINFDKSSIYFSENYKNSEQITIDYNPFFELNKTYRIEDQQGPGGLLVAELYIQSVLEASKKMICRIRPFALHKTSDGYLYIKDGEKTRFISNLNMVEKPKIEKVSIRKKGDDWDDDLAVNPGENIEVKIQGKGLLGNKIQFDDISDVKQDSSKSSDEALFFKLKIPLNISVKHISVFFNQKETQYRLGIKDFQKAVDFDFVSINYGQSDIALTNAKLNKPVFYDNIIKDINFVFDPNKIDASNKLSGKQYITIEIKLLNKDNDLIEVEKIEDIVICPGDKSARYAYYDKSDCKQATINLNDYLDHKTFSLPAFTQVQITVSHNENKYDDTKGFKKKIKIILERKYDLDLQLSFPTGLLLKDVNKSGIGDLSGISAAVLLNFGLYDDKQFGKLKPYTVGVGFLALNALNLSSTATSDVGAVVMGTVQPLRKSTKFSVPIYAGFGYFVKSGKYFLIFGPGLQFNF